MARILNAARLVVGASTAFFGLTLAVSGFMGVGKAENMPYSEAEIVIFFEGLILMAGNSNSPYY